MINSAFHHMKRWLSISFPSSSTSIAAETLPQIYYGAIKEADYLFRRNEIWFNGACVGLQASEWVLVFWASVQMLRVFKGKSVSTHEPFKSSSWLFPSSSAGWIAALCLTLPPLEMGEKWSPALDELLSPAGL